MNRNLASLICVIGLLGAAFANYEIRRSQQTEESLASLVTERDLLGRRLQQLEARFIQLQHTAEDLQGKLEKVQAAAPVPRSGDALPEADLFEQTFFTANGGPASINELVNAATKLVDQVQTIDGYLARHPAMSTQLNQFKGAAQSLLEAAGTDPQATAAAQENYAKALGRVGALTTSILGRVAETPEALEMTRRIQSRTDVIQKHLPQSVPAN